MTQSTASTSATATATADTATPSHLVTTIKKKTCDLYEVRAGYDWATICMRKWQSQSPSGEIRYGGEILIHSSFGNYNNTWGHCGHDFASFLLAMRRDSFAEKTMGLAAEVYDGPQTFRYLVGKIFKERRKNARFSILDKEGARELYELFLLSESDILSSEDDMVREVMRMDKGTWGEEAYSEPWNMVCKRPDPQVVGFWTTLWPVFMAQLKAEEEAAKTNEADQGAEQSLSAA